MDEQTKVLDWCNRVRDEHGKPLLAMLPYGIRNHTSDCVVARALDMCVGCELAFEPNGDPRDDIHLPAYVTQFIDDFDAGAYPGLDADRLVAMSA